MLKTICITCETAETSRKDGQCPNCSAISMKFDPKTNAFEDNQIQKLGASCVDCGFAHAAALKLVFKQGNGTTGGKVCPIAASPSLAFCLEASSNPQNFLVRCRNCQSRFHRSAGRPPKYASFEERDAARKENREITKIRLKRRALDRYEGLCVVCEGPADGIHWIAEPGKAPKRSREWVYARLLEDPEFARQYAPYCNDHRPWTYLERAKRGEVAAPAHWGTGL